MDGDDAAEKLRRLFRERGPAAIPRTTLRRLRRTATTAVLTAGAAARAQLTRAGALDDQAIEKLVLSLGELKGVAMKVGQILSYVDAPIPDNLRRQLAVLQVQSTPTPFAAVERTVREDLGAKADELLARLDRAPASSASIGHTSTASSTRTRIRGTCSSSTTGVSCSSTSDA
ncbi:MAG: hypothetical protein A2138_09695 [Deltaproteobacteria bacterium RBG_16_71_12]|nr:MAG: hypothetical protein A2138_09695 [Deltaproteobacteria bacterium RBG_16_71_12]